MQSLRSMARDDRCDAADIETAKSRAAERLRDNVEEHVQAMRNWIAGNAM